MDAALRCLAHEGITRVLVEGGARLARSLLEADLVDELILFRAPLRLGPEALGALDGAPLDAALARFRLGLSRPVGADRMEIHWRR
jgi:diaminohydroxyphosphoribosylaminopyrimidine deaminase/5-amino-6-(5-phosphoribosylamino)uracil reductase